MSSGDKMEADEPGSSMHRQRTLSRFYRLMIGCNYEGHIWIGRNTIPGGGWGIVVTIGEAEIKAFPIQSLFHWLKIIFRALIGGNRVLVAKTRAGSVGPCAVGRRVTFQETTLQHKAKMPAGQLKTTPLDPRFPNTNQAQHCWYVAPPASIGRFPLFSGSLDRSGCGAMANSP